MKLMSKPKALDLYCGLGGWSDGLATEGFEVLGVEINRQIAQRYKHDVIVADVKTLDGKRFRGFDLIIGSPPCGAFSNARYKSRHVHGKSPNPAEGMGLIETFWRIVKEAEPKFYAMENIKALTKYYPLKPQWEFMISKGGKRCLWTNIPLPLTPEYRFRHKIRDIPGWDKTRPLRSKIPLPVSRLVARVVRNALLEEKGR